MSLDRLIQRDREMRHDGMEVVLGDMTRLEFKGKYGLSCGTTVDYIVELRREFYGLDTHLQYIGECNFHFDML